MHIIELENVPQSQKISQLTHMCYIKITVEPYKERAMPLQCALCQQFYHVAANCQAPPAYAHCQRNIARGSATDVSSRTSCRLALYVKWEITTPSILQVYYKYNYVISAPSKLTHFPDRNPIGEDILDFVILSNVLSNHSIRTLGSLSTSEHNPVLLTIRGPLQTDENKPNFMYREADWKLFQSYVISNLNTQ
jgi:hypothetical protein